MSTNHSLHHDVKITSKRLQKLLGEVFPSSEVQLSSCQEIASKLMGYQNFHEAISVKEKPAQLLPSKKVILDDKLSEKDSSPIAYGISSCCPEKFKFKYEVKNNSLLVHYADDTLSYLENIYIPELLKDLETNLSPKKISLIFLRNFLRSSLQHCANFARKEVVIPRCSKLKHIKKVNIDLDTQSKIIISNEHTSNSSGNITENLANRTCSVCGFNDFDDIFDVVLEDGISGISCGNCKDAYFSKININSVENGTWIYLPELNQKEALWLIRWASLSVYADDLSEYLDRPKNIFKQWLIHRCELAKIMEKECGQSNIFHWVPFIIDGDNFIWYPNNNKNTLKRWERSVSHELPGLQWTFPYVQDGYKKTVKPKE